MTLSLAAVDAGTLLAGRYQVRRELGRGGMGVVYLCRDASSGEPVALKRLHRDKAGPEPTTGGSSKRRAPRGPRPPGDRARARLRHPRGQFAVPGDGRRAAAARCSRGSNSRAIPWPWPFTVLWSFIGPDPGRARPRARARRHPRRSEADQPDARLPRPEQRCPRCASSISGSRRWCAIRSIIGSTARRTAPRGRARGRGNARVDGARADPPRHAALRAADRSLRARQHPLPPALWSRAVHRHRRRGARRPRNQPRPELHVPPTCRPRSDRSCCASWPSAPGSASSTPATRGAHWQRLAPARRPPSRGTSASIRSPQKLEEQISLDTRLVQGPRRSARREQRPRVRARPARPAAEPARRPQRGARRASTAAVDAHVHARRAPCDGSSLLYGEAGVGKSRLAEWLCESVHERAVMVPLRARYRKIPAPLDGIVGAVNAHFGLERADRNLVEKTLINCWEVGQGRRGGAHLGRRDRRVAPPHAAGQRAFRSGRPASAFSSTRPKSGARSSSARSEKIGQSRPILLWLDDLHLASARTFETLAELLRGSGRAAHAARGHRAQRGGRRRSARPRRASTTLRAHYAGQVIELRPLVARGHATSSCCRRFRSTRPRCRRRPRAAAATRSSRSSCSTRGPRATACSWPRAATACPRKRSTSAPGPPPSCGTSVWPRFPRIFAAPRSRPRRSAATFPRASCARSCTSLAIPADPAVDALHRAQILVPSGPDRLRWPHALLQEHLLERLMAHPDAQADLPARGRCARAPPGRRHAPRRQPSRDQPAPRGRRDRRRRARARVRGEQLAPRARRRRDA